MNIALRNRVVIGSTVAMCAVFWALGFYDRDQRGPLAAGGAELQQATFRLRGVSADGVSAGVYAVEDAALLGELRQALASGLEVPVAKYIARGQLELRDRNGEACTLGLFLDPDRLLVGMGGRFYRVALDLQRFCGRQ